MQFARRAFSAIAIALALAVTTAMPASAAVTTPVLVPGAPDAVYEVVAYQDALYGVAVDGADIGFFHFADGTSARLGTVENPRTFVEFEGVLYFIGNDGSDNVLYSFDGTNLAPVAGSPTSALYLGIYQGELIMTAENAGGDLALFTFDDVLPPFFDEFVLPDNPTSASLLAEYDGVQYVVSLVVGNFELYSFDGTTVAAVPAAPEFARDGVVFNGLLYFVAEDGADDNLFSFDGTDFVEIAAVPDDPHSLLLHQGAIFFSAGPAGPLMRFDGVTSAAVPGSPTEAYGFAAFGTDLFFSSGPEGVLTRFDGANFQTFAGVYNLNSTAVIGDTLYFSAADAPGMDQSRLWSLSIAPDPALAATGSSPALALGAAALVLAAGALALAWRRRAASPPTV